MLLLRRTAATGRRRSRPPDLFLYRQGFHGWPLDAGYWWYRAKLYILVHPPPEPFADPALLRADPDISITKFLGPFNFITFFVLYSKARRNSFGQLEPDAPIPPPPSTTTSASIWILFGVHICARGIWRRDGYVWVSDLRGQGGLRKPHGPLPMMILHLNFLIKLLPLFSHHTGLFLYISLNHWQSCTSFHISR